MSCTLAETGDADAECCAVVGDTCEHTADCHWRVTAYLDDCEWRWCDTHHREYDLSTDN